MPALTPDIPAVELQIVEMTNAFRADNKLEALAPNAQLTKAARTYAAYLARNGAFSHTADGHDVAHRVEAAGYHYCQVAENLALDLDSRGFTTHALASAAIEGWKNSPAHRKNLLAADMTETGVGVVRAPGNDPKYISVQLFARPLSLQYQFVVRNLTVYTVRYDFGGERHEIMPGMAITHAACTPGSIAFSPSSGNDKTPQTRSTYQAADGQIYLLRPDSVGGYKVEVRPGSAR